MFCRGALGMSIFSSNNLTAIRAISTTFCSTAVICGYTNDDRDVPDIVHMATSCGIIRLRS